MSRHVDAGIAAVAADVVRAVGGQRRRRDVERAAPDLDLLGADLVDHLLLVEAGQPAIMALVEAPVLGHRQPQPVHLVQHQVERADGAGLDAGEAAVEVEALRRASNRPRRAPRRCPGRDRSTSHQPVKRFSRFHCDWPCRSRTSVGIRRRPSRAWPSARLFSSGRIAWSASRQAQARYFERSRRPAVDRVGQVEIVLERHFQRHRHAAVALGELGRRHRHIGLAGRRRSHSPWRVWKSGDRRSSVVAEQR